MRIVGGKFRGRKLAVPKSSDIRPTTDRNRESLFNILTHLWRDKFQHSRVLDVFAGTGALGLEAVSGEPTSPCSLNKAWRAGG